jgi:hypothetical protein
MKLKIIFSLILIIVLSIVGISYYSSTDVGRYNLFVENTLKHVKHVSEVRNNVEMSEAISWYGGDFQRSNPALTKCIIEGIEYAYKRPELSPSEIIEVYERKIHTKKSFWLTWVKRIKDK